VDLPFAEKAAEVSFRQPASFGRPESNGRRQSDPVLRSVRPNVGRWPEFHSAEVSFHDAHFGRQVTAFEIELAMVRARPIAELQLLKLIAGQQSVANAIGGQLARHLQRSRATLACSGFISPLPWKGLLRIHRQFASKT
jgi:hypothetical protein